MIYTFLEKGTLKKIKPGIIAMLLREKFYEDYKDAKFDFKELNDMDTVSINVENNNKEIEEIVNLDEANYYEMQTESIAETTLDWFNIYYIKRLGDKAELGELAKIENLDNFSQMGGVKAVFENGYILLSLNYLDLYDVIILNKSKDLTLAYSNIYGMELQEILGSWEGWEKC